MEIKPLSVEISWYSKDVEIYECNWSMVQFQKVRAKKKSYERKSYLDEDL